MCLLTLKCEADEKTLAPPALKFAQQCGSPARTAPECKDCPKFIEGLLKGFATCNRLVAESSRRLNFLGRVAQLKKFAMLLEQLSQERGTLDQNGQVSRFGVLTRFESVVASIYGMQQTSNLNSLVGGGMGLTLDGGAGIGSSPSDVQGRRGSWSMVPDHMNAPHISQSQVLGICVRVRAC